MFSSSLKLSILLQAGIGTYTIPQIATPFWAKLNKTVDTAIAWNLDAHVMRACRISAVRLNLTLSLSQRATSFLCKTVRLIDVFIERLVLTCITDQAGDKICIFGFSRGAYIARSIAGMVHKVGLLPACNSQQVPFAYKMYTRADEIGWKQSVAFKKAFSMDVDIEFVGVW